MLGEEIKRIRTLRGITQRDLAKMVNVKPNTMSQYETGKSEVSFHILREISHALSCSTLDLAYEELDIEKPSISLQSTSIGAGQADDSVMEKVILELFASLDVKRRYKVLDYIREQVIVAEHYKKIK